MVGGRRFNARFGFPDDLSVALRGLVQRVRGKHGSTSDEGRALESLEEIRVTGSPSWTAEAIDVFIIFCPATRTEADDALRPEQWDGLVDAWVRRTEAFGTVRSIDGAMIPLDELSGREYVDSDPLDLDYLSWGQADAS